VEIITLAVTRLGISEEARLPVKILVGATSATSTGIGAGLDATQINAGGCGG
jgi:hypothetical protein